MDVRTFVSETLTQIVGGIADAQIAIREMNNGAQVNPTYRVSDSKRTGADASAVEFDIAVTVVHANERDETGKFSGSITVASLFKAAGSTEEKSGSANRNEAVSRVKFTVQLAQPAELLEARGVRSGTGTQNWMA